MLDDDDVDDEDADGDEEAANRVARARPTFRDSDVPFTGKSVRDTDGALSLVPEAIVLYGPKLGNTLRLVVLTEYGARASERERKDRNVFPRRRAGARRKIAAAAQFVASALSQFYVVPVHECNIRNLSV